MKEVRASLRRHWLVALIILLLLPVVMVVYLVGRDVERPPARFTTSADVLIPARDTETGGPPEDVPPVLLQGQEELVQSPETQDEALQRAQVDPEQESDITLAGNLNDDQSIMTLVVSGPEPEVVNEVIDGYIVAYQNGRRRSVLEAAAELQDIQVKVIDTLTARLDDIEAELGRRGLALPPRVPDGDPVALVPGTSTESGLLLYERNAVLNEIQRRQVGYSLSATEATAPGTFTTVVQRRSTARTTPPPPSPLIPLLEILGIGLALALAVPFVLDRLDPTITEARAAPGALRAGLLGTIPFLPKRLHRQLAPPGSTWEHAFRSLAATSLSTDRLPRALMVTSPTGSTQDVVAANFAAGLAELGVSVALIGTVPGQEWFLDNAEDADTELEGLEARTAPFGSEPRAGATATAVRTFPDLLADAEAGRLVGDIRPRLATRGIENLVVVPPGPAGSELLSLDGLPPLLEALSSSGIDICVLAGPALLEDPNATIMAWSTRHVLWAIEIGQVNKNDAQLAADRIELAGVTPFGLALVDRHALRA
jgi:hypothetical protein